MLLLQVWPLKRTIHPIKDDGWWTHKCKQWLKPKLKLFNATKGPDHKRQSDLVEVTGWAAKTHWSKTWRLVKTRRWHTRNNAGKLTQRKSQIHWHLVHTQVGETMRDGGKHLTGHGESHQDFQIKRTRTFKPWHIQMLVKMFPALQRFILLGEKTQWVTVELSVKHC